MRIETSLRVGKNLAVLRNSVFLSQAQVAAELCVCRASYAKYECGERLPDMKTMYDLAQFYHVSIDALLNRNMNSVLTEHFLHYECSNENAFMLSAFNDLSEHSKRQVRDYAQQLVNIETKRKHNMRLFTGKDVME